jgi:hypothetical protein
MDHAPAGQVTAWRALLENLDREISEVLAALSSVDADGWSDEVMARL